MGIETAAVMKFAEIASDLVGNPKVRQMTATAWNGVYGSIFGKKIQPEAKETNTNPQPTERQLIENLLDTQATNVEMRLAFSVLEAKLQRGQQQMLIGIIVFGALNMALLVYIIVK